jgi:Protein of unknown function (DUF3631)
VTYCPLDLVENYLRRFVIYPSEHALAAHVLWIAHTHLMDHWESTPRLAFMSPEPESGKTRALEVTSLFVSNPRLSFSMSTAALVRIVAKGHKNNAIPTILYDEIDNLFSKNEEGISDLRGALNSGYRRNAVSTRCVNKGEGIADFVCYAPLAMAGLKTLPDALATRAIFIHMRPRADDEPKESFRLRHHPAEAAPIMEALTEWCAEIEANVIGYEPEMPTSITDRSADIWEPLFAIADMAGSDWPSRARQAAVYLTGAAKDDNLSSGRELLAHIRDALLEADKIWTSTLCQRLRDREESPWADIKGKPLDERGLSVRLKAYRIKSRDVRIDGVVRKGFCRSDFADAFKRYLSREADLQGSATSATSATNLNNKNNFVADVADVADRRLESEAVVKPLITNPEAVPIARLHEDSEFEERAAILEYDAGLTREEAEAQAAADIPELPQFLRRRAG